MLIREVKDKEPREMVSLKETQFTTSLWSSTNCSGRMFGLSLHFVIWFVGHLVLTDFHLDDQSKLSHMAFPLMIANKYNPAIIIIFIIIIITSL